MPPNTLHFLEVRESTRKKRLEHLAKPTTKKSRMKRKFELLRKEEEEAKKQRGKRDGTYKSGGHMANDEGFDGIETQQQKTPKQVKICPHCGLQGHVQKTSKYCKLNPQNVLSTTELTNPPAPDTQESGLIGAEVLGLDPAEDIDAHDAIPFDVDLPGIDFAADDEFHDCGTWSEDEEGMTMVSGRL